MQIIMRKWICHGCGAVVYTEPTSRSVVCCGEGMTKAVVPMTFDEFAGALDSGQVMYEEGS